ncbi:uncharacterized protein METZ01_LOCUS506368, partial [marine metagenome]
MVGCICTSGDEHRQSSAKTAPRQSKTNIETRSLGQAVAQKKGPAKAGPFVGLVGG